MRSAASLLLLTSACCWAAEPPPGFTAIFNGKDLGGWHGWKIHDDGKGGPPAEFNRLTPEEQAKKISEWTDDAKKHWSIENGELVNDGNGAYLATEALHGDIELLLEYRTVPLADSGIYLRSTPQVQIWDYTEERKFKLGADKGSGGLWNNSPNAPGKDPLVLADKPFGEWNKFRILQIGERTTVYLNDQLVVDHARMENYWNRRVPLPREGKILLQTHGGEIRWRNIFVRKIEAAEANRLLAEKATAGMSPLFNGNDLEGWTGAVGSYEVKDGAIVCKPNKSGALITKDRFADFEAAIEFKLPPGGNNGLGIRYPGTGDAAYSGMCELQIIDNDAEKYKSLDPRQFHGSAYGMVAAHRGYLRPAGEWNFQTVSVVGSKIKVELNGTIILDCDLAEVNEFMDNTPHPGKDVKEGHFALLGHNDPVAFRSILIRKKD